MDFVEFLARLAIGIDEPHLNVVQTFRAIRVQTNELAAKAMEARAARAPDDSAATARLAAAVISDEQGAAWLAGVDAALSLPSYRGKPGPGGGLEADAGSVALFLTAYLVGGPRRSIAETALNIGFAVYEPPAGEQDPLCRMTGMRTFIDAFEFLLTDRRTFGRAVAISVNPDLGVAEITFKPSPEADELLVSRFVIPSKAKQKSFSRSAVLHTCALSWLLDACHGVDAPVKALAPA
jgi:hypothetical protein